MGGMLLQGVNRDTNKFAMKCSAACVDGQWRDVYKDPITDKGKVSKKGRMSLFRSRLTGEYVTYRIDGPSIDSEWEDQLTTVYEDGELVVEYNFDEIRRRAAGN
jgi:nicotinamide phosphoribosyltransferase